MDTFTAIMVICLIGVGFLIRKELKRSAELDAQNGVDQDKEMVQVSSTR